MRLSWTRGSKRGLAMPRGKKTGKPPGNAARQLLFSEALHPQKHPLVKDPKDPPPHSHIITGNMEEGPQGESTDRILPEISTVGRKLEGMDSAMLALTAETRSMRLEIAGFKSQISGLDQRVARVETQVASWTDNGNELMHLRSKLTDLEDRSRRNNIRLMGLPEGMEGTDLTSFLRDTLPKLTDITFDPPSGIRKGAQAGSEETGRKQTPPLNHSLPPAPWSSSPTITGSPGTRPTEAGHYRNPTLS
ncbi:hypothetical protein NDU88_001705 [Pleurodeles waltl]|uniref:Uncharacterized protein n=1 Tax=Pleurodeles waltl TaxID=8319 RepID=A0AAV7LGR5_PLEWA|nr:hypothetical protein NDU88_001705 [Pleurodeles waltl]